MEKDVSSCCKNHVSLSSPCWAWLAPVAAPRTVEAVVPADVVVARAVLEHPPVVRMLRPRKRMRQARKAMRQVLNKRCPRRSVVVVAVDRGSPFVVPIVVPKS